VSLELGGDRDRMPVPAHQLSARGARPNAREPLVLFLRDHQVSPSRCLERLGRLSRNWRPGQGRTGGSRYGVHLDSPVDPWVLNPGGLGALCLRCKYPRRTPRMMTRLATTLREFVPEREEGQG